MTKAEFTEMLNELANAWERRDYGAAAGFFSEDIRYADPTRYRMASRAELLQFFRDDGGYPQHTQWRLVIFDQDQQVGAAEYTYTGTYQYHGVVVIRVGDGFITHWREYQHIDSRAWEDFASGTAF